MSFMFFNNIRIENDRSAFSTISWSSPVLWINLSILFKKSGSSSIFIQTVDCLQHISALAVGRPVTKTIVKILMAEPAFVMFSFLLLSKGLSKPFRVEVISEVESCDPTFRETSHFAVSLEDCTTSRPLTTTYYNTTERFASNDSPTTTTFESMVTAVKPPGPNCTLIPKEYLRGRLSQGNNSIPEDFIDTQFRRNKD